MERLFTGPATIKTLADKQGIEHGVYDFNNRDRQKLLNKILSIPVETEEGKEEAIRFLFGLADYYKSRIKNLNENDVGAIEMVNSTVNAAFRYHATKRIMKGKYISFVKNIFGQRKSATESIENRKKMWDELIMVQFGPIIL